MTRIPLLFQPREPDGSSFAEPPEHPIRSFRAMGCEMSLTIATADTAAAEAAFDAGRQQIELVESCLSRFRPESELMRLNAQDRAWTTVSPLLGGVLRVALQAARQSGGICTPTVLDALEAAGYDRDFAQVGGPLATPPRASERPDERTARSGRKALRQVAVRRLRADRPSGAQRVAQTGAWRAIRLDQQIDGSTRVRLPRGVRLDLGGVAKGWTADHVAMMLAQVGPCLVDAGGDLAARGAPAGLDGWPVAVADPHQPDADLAVVLLRDAGIATSGVDFRRWSQQGRPRHHLIDPRAGEPSRTDVLTASVIARTTTEADVHAKIALLLGVRGGLAYLARKSLAGLIVRRDGRVLMTPRWSDHAISE
jgi:thiamine biosynthesis lipoprotein